MQNMCNNNKKHGVHAVRNNRFKTFNLNCNEILCEIQRLKTSVSQSNSTLETRFIKLFKLSIALLLRLFLITSKILVLFKLPGKPLFLALYRNLDYCQDRI